MQQPDAPPGRHLLDASRFVHPQVVQHDDVPWGQRRPQPLRHIGPQHRRGHRPCHGRHGWPPVGPEGPQPRHVWPIVLQDGPSHPRPFRGTPIQVGHGQIHAGFSNALQPVGIERGGHLPVPGTRLLAPRRVTLGGMQF
jgi:hypothetical protein